MNNFNCFNRQVSHFCILEVLLSKLTVSQPFNNPLFHCGPSCCILHFMMALLKKKIFIPLHFCKENRRLDTCKNDSICTLNVILSIKNVQSVNKETL